jgi:hypothetical protein
MTGTEPRFFSRQESGLVTIVTELLVLLKKIDIIYRKE